MLNYQQCSGLQVFVQNSYTVRKQLTASRGPPAAPANSERRAADSDYAEGSVNENQLLAVLLVYARERNHRNSKLAEGESDLRSDGKLKRASP